MLLPYVENGFLHINGNWLDLNHCGVAEFERVWGRFDSCIFANEQIAQFVINNDLGETYIFFDNASSGLLIQIHLELLEEIPFWEFLRLTRHRRYAYFENENDLYLIFNPYVMARLRVNSQKIASLIFSSRNFFETGETDFYVQAKRALANRFVLQAKEISARNLYPQ